MKPQAPFARRLLLAFAALSLMFVCATLVATWLSYSIEARTDVIAGNALPSIDHLSAACDALRDLEAASDDYPELSPEKQRAAREAIDRMWREVDSDLTAYLAIPGFPGERELYEPAVPVALREVSAALTRLFVQAEQHGGPPRAGADRDVREAATHAAKLLRRLVTYNAAQAQDQVRRIALTHRAAAQNALILDGMAVLFGLAVFLWVLQQWRTYDALLQAHASMVERRANELEEFGARVAHDLISPLSALTYCLGAFKRASEADPKLQEALTRARGCVHRAQKMVDSIFEFARAGGRAEPGASADLREVVERVTEEALMVESGERATVTVEPFENCRVACNPSVLGGILGNLMHNAVKYMSDSALREVTVRVRERSGAVRVEVEDSGPGVPRGMEERIFEPYVRAEGVTQAGLGLGLATVKRLCEAYGGEVGVRSTPGRGSIFWFTLPKPPTSAELPSAPALRRVS